MIELPPVFMNRVTDTHGQAGRDWLQTLPELLDSLSRTWSLSDLIPLSDLSFNLIVFARNETGKPVVLKAGVPNPELSTEILALKIYNGKGAVKILDADPELGALLLERLKPGEDLRSCADDARATQIAGEVMKRIWRPDPDERAFPTTADWCRGFDRYQLAYPDEGPLPAALVEKAALLAEDLLASAPENILLHGDLHHMNVLLGDSGWMAIDPKGVIGEPAFEAGALLLNPFPDLITEPDIHQIQARRLDMLSEILAARRDRLASWGFVRAVLSAIWSVEDRGFWNYAIEVAQTLWGFI